MKVIILFLISLCAHFATAEQYGTLYGLSLGSAISTASNKLGQPDKIIDLESGEKVLVFMQPDHYAAIVTIPPQYDFIFSIQVTGVKSKGDQSIGGIVLGDDFSKVINKFGQPTESKSAIDLQTQAELKDTNIHLYGENFSFEEVKGKVTSIKLTYDGTLSSDNPADEKLMAQQPIEIQRVQKFILNEGYPEVFKDQHYRISINNIMVIDLDMDGLNEVVVQYAPHYSQSPTIVIYKISKDGVVSRVNEGLAPGPLVKRTEHLLDSHVNGEGVDFTVGAKQTDPDKKKKISKLVLAKGTFGMLIQFPSFFHADMRQSEHSYIDMSHVTPYSGELKCREFEFSTVDSISVGYLEDNESGKKTSFIAAAIGNEIYLYKIFGFDENGLLNKNLTIINDTKVRKAG